MGFVLTIIYIVLTIISPEQFGREWADYHALVYLAILTGLASLPNVLNRIHKPPVQTVLMIGFIIVIGVSQITNGWLGGAIESWLRFLPNVAVFFFIVVNVTTVRRLKIMTLTVSTTCLLLTLEALYGYYSGFRADIFVLHQNLYQGESIVGEFIRLRGAGFLNDPNDFAQILLIAIALFFVGWQHKNLFANCLLVLLPSAVLLWAIFLTHSRGALVGLVVLALVAGRNRFGTSLSMATTILLVIGMLAINFTGGRAISASEGSDRLEAWSTGLELFKSAPLFGIGFGGFTDYNEITAHNSFVLCLAELGLMGSLIWIALLVTSTMGLNKIIDRGETEPDAREGEKSKAVLAVGDGNDELLRLRPESESNPSGDSQWQIAAGAQAELEEHPASWVDWNSPELSRPEEIEQFPSPSLPSATDTEDITGDPLDSETEHMVPKHWPVAIRFGLISYMTTGWFLSRSYATTLYLILGLATATILLDEGSADIRDRNRWIVVTFSVEALAIVLIYVSVRLGR